MAEENHLNENLKGKVVVITGGGQGIGKNLAINFAKNEATVIICSRTKEDVDLTTAEIRKFNEKCQGFPVDVSNLSEIKKFFAHIQEEHKKIDVLINCAGIYGTIGPLEKNDMEIWKKTLEINVLGTVNCMHTVIPMMKENKSGKIINLCGGGVGSDKIKPNFSAYNTSKSAVAILTESIANELKALNIQVNAVSPGAVNTRLLDQLLAAGELAGKERIDESKKQKEEGGTPPEKTSELCLFLATEKSNLISGKLISAVWDNYREFSEEELNSSLYTLRRIDNFQFKQIK